ncbi:hypothetical protein ACS0TY_003850 [Phlomoides rotata]
MDEIEENGKAMAQHYKNLEAQQKTMEFQIGQLATTVGHMQNKGPPIPNEHDNEEKKEDETEQEAEDDKDLSEHDEEEEIAHMKEDEEEKGMMKSDKEEKRIPKWKLAKDL